MRLDHLVVAAGARDVGAARIAARLGPAQGGGAHPKMGTHNRLWRLGDAYLEAIAIDPAAPRPADPRWFGLDAPMAGARLCTWVMAVDDLEAALARAPVGRIHRMTRGDLNWRIAFPESGAPLWGGAVPALIEWPQDARRPPQRMPDRGWRIASLRIAAPAGGLAALRALGADRIAGVTLAPGPASLCAVLTGPAGRATLRSSGANTPRGVASPRSAFAGTR